jgi:flavin reductase (DIM6/NTAB) family NADH-FMN oxidoreductase RutF
MSNQPSPDALRDALRFWTTGVTIVATTHEATVHGMTVNSFTSLSLDPPLVSISLEKITRTHKLVQASGIFSVSILGDELKALSDRFAGRETDHTDRFKGVPTLTLETGSPIVKGCLAYFDCRVSASEDAGSHTVFIGEVLACGQKGESQQPLIYFNRDYRKLK